MGNAYDLINEVVNKYIVRPTGSPNLIGAGGFVFDVLDTETVYLDSEITDHYIEDNSAIQDHIALKPVRFMLRGFIGELNDVFPQFGMNLLTSIQSIGTMGGLIPNMSTQATKTYAKIAGKVAKVTSVINSAQNVYDIFTRHSTQATKQQKAFKFFQDLRASRILVSVETPWRLYENMAIESLHPLQSGESRFITQFDVTFKQIKTVKTNLVKTAGVRTRATDMMASFSNRGKTAGSSLDGNKSVSVDILSVAY